MLMKLEALIFSVILVGMSPTFAQETTHYFVTESDNNFLRNYKAPDLKLRGLTLAFDGNGQGATTELNNDQSAQGRLGLSFFQVGNTSKFQAGTSAYLQSSFSLRNDNADVDYFLLLQGYHNRQNRFFLKNSWFYGIHNQTDFRLTAVENNNTLRLTIKPAFSIGLGRIELVAFARKAMDVERMLIQGGRFSTNFSETNRKELADKIAKIEYKRFFDPRLARIYQLQALDSMLQEQGIITESDILYFSLLQDAFLFGDYQNRRSGIRHELGIAQGISLLPAAADEYMSYGFYKFSYYLPKNYVVQHNFETSVIGGLLADNTALTTNDFRVWVDANYELGFYPTTRTFFSVGVGGGINLSNQIGYVSQANLNTYYYISPRFRFSLQGQFRYGENYSAHDFNVAVNNFDRLVKQTSYSFRLGLVYSVF